MKKVGRRSQGANDFLMPKAPTINSATDVGTSRAWDNGAVDIVFTPDPTYAATSYTVLSEPGSYDATGSASPIRIEGLPAGSYQFKIDATNQYGTSEFSALSSSVSVTTVPETPAAPTASSPSAGTDSVSWNAPATGGKSISGYSWESDDSKSGSTDGSTTSVSVSQEQGTTQAYRVKATNANGDSNWSSYSSNVTTTFSFVPFGAFGFTPFGFTPFGFTPFGFTPFGFTPFGAFGFTPFGAFGFTPFGAFGFLNFGFSPSQCVYENTLIKTPAGLVAAKDIKIGDKVYTLDITEVNPNDSMSLNVASLTSNGLIEVEVQNIESSQKDTIVWFNNDESAKFSQEQPMFVKRDGQYGVISSGLVDTGDILLKANGSGDIEEVEVTEVNTQEGEFNVYSFSTSPQTWYIAGDYLVHTK